MVVFAFQLGGVRSFLKPVPNRPLFTQNIFHGQVQLYSSNEGFHDKGNYTADCNQNLHPEVADQYDYDLEPMIENIDLEDFRGRLIARESGSTKKNEAVDLDRLPRMVDFDPDIEAFRDRLIRQYEKGHLVNAASRTKETHIKSKIQVGSVLIAGKDVKGPFEQAVLLVVEHNEKRGIVKGLLINKPTSTKVNHIFTESLRYAFNNQNIYEGGPSGKKKYVALLNTSKFPAGYQLRNNLFLSKLTDLKAVLNRRVVAIDKSKAKLIEGHTECSISDMEHAVASGDWYVLPRCLPSDYLFSADPHSVWQELTEAWNEIY